MIVSNHNLLSLIDKKLHNCFQILSEYVSAFANTIDWQCREHFDYDPINCDRFIEVLCSLVGDIDLYVIYTNLDCCVVQKSIQLNVSGLLSNDSVLKDLRENHASLYDCTIEGSYYLFGDSGEWAIFYDAGSDFGVMLSQNNRLMVSMAEFLIS